MYLVKILIGSDEKRAMLINLLRRLGIFDHADLEGNYHLSWETTDLKTVGPVKPVVTVTSPPIEATIQASEPVVTGPVESKPIDDPLEIPVEDQYQPPGNDEQKPRRGRPPKNGAK